MRVPGREYDHHECLNCGFSDEPNELALIEARLGEPVPDDAEAPEGVPSGD